jgi:hypothetical protein
LNIPQTYARRILGLTEASQAAKILKEMSIAVLNDIMNLPQQVTDPNWLETLEGDGDTSKPVASTWSKRPTARKRKRKQ